VEVFTDGEEARLAFVGATRALTEPVTDAVAVVDVGGGSSEFVIGTIDRGVT
jgi:exopolyphosphatase/guanosine-5'-triphosphate,3'-diphosphate pyrophosphatase